MGGKKCTQNSQSCRSTLSFACGVCGHTFVVVCVIQRDLRDDQVSVVRYLNAVALRQKLPPLHPQDLGCRFAPGRPTAELGLVADGNARVGRRL